MSGVEGGEGGEVAGGGDEGFGHSYRLTSVNVQPQTKTWAFFVLNQKFV